MILILQSQDHSGDHCIKMNLKGKSINATNINLMSVHPDLNSANGKNLPKVLSHVVTGNND